MKINLVGSNQTEIERADGVTVFYSYKTTEGKRDMKKINVQFHADGCCRPAHPAVNVKCYDFARGLTADSLRVDQATLDRAAQFAFETLAESFWEQAAERVRELFGPSANLYSEGRHEGWAVVHGLPDVERWDAVMLAKWASFIRFCRESIRCYASAETVREMIEFNEWNKAGAELYNFTDTDGGTACIADMKREAVDAGFGAVVRA